MLFAKHIILYSLFITSSSYLISYSYQNEDQNICIQDEIFPLEKTDFIVEVDFYTDDIEEIKNKEKQTDDTKDSQPAKIVILEKNPIIEVKNIESANLRAIDAEDDFIEPVPHELINCVKKSNKEKKKLEKKQKKEKRKLCKKSKKKQK